MNEPTRHTIQILGLLVFIVAFGTLGYLTIEDGWSLGEAFYMTVITVTTVGFGETHDLSPNGRVFTVILIFLGLGAAALFASQVARWIIGNEIKGLFSRKQMHRTIMRMKDHHIVCGYGRIGRAICSELEREGLPFVVVEINEEMVALAEQRGYCAIRGNATTDASLKDAGIERAAGVVAALSADADNLFISLAARELNPKILIISRGEEPGVEDRILRAGADIVVSPIKLGGQQIAQLIAQQAGVSSQAVAGEQVSSVLGLSLRVFRHSREDITTVTGAVKETGALLAVAIKHEDGSIVTGPPADMEISSHDSVIMVVKNRPNSQKSVFRETDNRKILLVDDHRALRLLFARKIRSAGHEVVTAASGDEAINMAQEHEPDLIVLDVVMPGKSGYEACNIIKQTPKLENVPIILYSADETEEFLKRGKQSGADACLRKTSKSSELLAKIEELLPQDQEQMGRAVI